MRQANERAPETTSKLSEFPELEVEWEELLQILRRADSPVGEAVYWFESRGYGTHFGVYGKEDMVGKRRRVREPWRFVPDLLASEVVYDEEQEETKRAGAIGNCIWLQTLPSAMQTNVLTFLNVEHLHFRSRDLEALSCFILQSPMGADFWVLQAATALLRTSLRDSETSLPTSVTEEQIARSQDAKMADYSAVPEWLHRYIDQSCSSFSSLPAERYCNLKEGLQVQDVNKISESCDVLLSEPDSTNEDVKQEMRASSSPLRSHQEEPKLEAEDKPEPEKAKVCRETRDQLQDGDDTNEAADNQMEDIIAKETLGDDLFVQALSLRRALRSRPGAGLPEEIKLVRSTPKFASLLSVVRAWEVDDEVTLLLVGSLLVEQDGYSWSTQVLKSIMLPKLIDLEKPASRLLITALIQAGKTHPRAIMDSVMFPLISLENGASNIHCELLNRMIKDCLPEDLILSLLQKMFALEEGSHLSWKWTEGMVGVVQNLLNYKVNLDQQSIDCLVQALDVAVSDFSRSLKFGNLILNLVTKHGSSIKSYKTQLQQVVGQTQTFLAKSIQAKLAAI